MQNNPVDFMPKKASQWFWIFASTHVFVWTFLPALFRQALPMDAIEGYAWGHQLEWGYDRNPWMNAWLTRLATDLGGSFAVYFFSQLFVLLAFFSVWRLGSKFLPAWCALAAVLILEGMQYNNIAAIDFNDNVILLGLWPFLAYLYYCALTEEKLLTWTAVGIIGGLAMMTKYYSICLLFPMLLLLMYNKTLQQQFRKPGLYLAIALCLLISLPHALWLFSNHFQTIDYALNRVQIDAHPTELAQLQNTLHFFVIQSLTFLVGAILLLFLFIGQKKTSPMATEPLLLMRQFLWFVAIGPFLCTLLLSVFLHWHLHSLWGTPLLSLWGLLLLSYRQPTFDAHRLRRLLIASFTVLFLLSGGTLIGYFHAGNRYDATFPAKNISNAALALWQKNIPNQPLSYVVADRYLGAYVSYFAPHPRPAVFIDGDKIISPWINEKELRQSGAIFVWKKDEPLPDTVLKMYPQLKRPHEEIFQRTHDPKNQYPVDLLFAVLPPQT